MGFDVKNTTRRKLFEIICPHYCMVCGEIGAIMCERCKNDNSCDEMTSCLNCGVVVKNGHCDVCDLPFARGFAVGKREGILGKMVEAYKYKSTRALCVPIAEMLDATLPCLPAETLVVPMPTVARHVRMRGFDHTWLVAKELARRRGWKCERLVVRVKDSVQMGADKKTRKKQAEEAYGLSPNWRFRGLGGEGEKPRKRQFGLSEIPHFLVVDDVWTTGASMKAVCGLLKKAGAKDITVAVLAKS